MSDMFNVIIPLSSMNRTNLTSGYDITKTSTKQRDQRRLGEMEDARMRGSVMTCQCKHVELDFIGLPIYIFCSQSKMGHGG